MKRLIFLSLFLLFVSLGCMAVQRMVSTPAATSAPPASVTPSDSVPSTDATDTPPAPAPTPITCTDDSCLNACLSRINEELSTQPQAEVGGNYTGADARFNLVTYRVEGDMLLDPDILWVPSEYKAYQQDAAAHQRVWKYFTSLIPAEQRKWITNYIIFTDGNSGEINTLAWVAKLAYDDNSRWGLGVDILDAGDPVNLTETLVHEVAHLVTLNSDQIHQQDDFIFSPIQNPSVCPQFMTAEGCSTQQSYINLFYQAFWRDIYADWVETVYNADASDEQVYYEAVDEFYSKYWDQFAEAYAASAIEEDLAVSFEDFILRPRATGYGISAQKMRFFYDFPELVTLRTQMIQGMCSYVQ